MNFHSIRCIMKRVVCFISPSLWRGDIKHTTSFIIHRMEWKFIWDSFYHMKVVRKCRFWHSSIFRIGFSFDDVTSNRTVPESASVATTYGVADSGPVLFLESYFGAMTSRRLVAVATTYGVADSGTVLFLESDFGATTSLVSAMVGDISDSGTFWCDIPWWVPCRMLYLHKTC